MPGKLGSFFRMLAGAILVLAVTVLLWSALLWISFQIPETPTREMAGLASGASQPEEDFSAAFLQAGRSGLWLIYCLLPALTGLIVGVASTTLSLRSRPGLLLGSLLSAALVLLAGTLAQPSAWAGAAAYLGAVWAGDRLRRRFRPEPSHGSTHG